MAEQFSHDQEWDDERLLAYALQLGDDPELEAALAAQPLLQRRLAAIEADIATIVGGLDALVPPASPAYGQPSNSRWRNLQPYFAAAGAGNAGAGRRPIWRRLLIPALALLLVAGAAIGLTTVLRESDRGTGGAARQLHAFSPATAPSSAAPLVGVAPSAAAFGSSASSSSASASSSATPAPTPLPSADGYGVVVVARAGRLVAGKQTYTVLRVLKGKSAITLTISPPSGELAPVGAVRLLYLQPVIGKPIHILTLPANMSPDQLRLP